MLDAHRYKSDATGKSKQHRKKKNQISFLQMYTSIQMQRGSMLLALLIIQLYYLNDVHPVPSSRKLSFVICRITRFYFQHINELKSTHKIVKSHKS